MKNQPDSRFAQALQKALERSRAKFRARTQSQADEAYRQALHFPNGSSMAFSPLGDVDPFFGTELLGSRPDVQQNTAFKNNERFDRWFLEGLRIRWEPDLYR